MSNALAELPAVQRFASECVMAHATPATRNNGAEARVVVGDFSALAIVLIPVVAEMVVAVLKNCPSHTAKDFKRMARVAKRPLLGVFRRDRLCRLMEDDYDVVPTDRLVLHEAAAKALSAHVATDLMAEANMQAVMGTFHAASLGLNSSEL